MGLTQSSQAYQAPPDRYTISQIQTTLAELNLGRFGAAFVTVQQTAPTMPLAAAANMLQRAGAAPGEIAAFSARLPFVIGGKPSRKWQRRASGGKIVRENLTFSLLIFDKSKRLCGGVSPGACRCCGALSTI